MRRREKFVLFSIILSVCLLVIQYISLDYRYLATGIFMLFTYICSAIVLSDDLNPHEWLVILPLPTMYAGGVSLFYFLLPDNFLSRLLIISTFTVGMYALFLTANIYSVAKGRTIQLLYAAHTVGLFFNIIIILIPLRIQ